MRVLVTGASGLIGSAVCDALLARGDEVVGLSRDPARAREHQPDRLLARLGPGQRAPARGGLRGRRRGRQPDRREHQPAADRRGQAADPRQPRAGDQEPRRRDARRHPQPATLVSQCAVGYYGDRGEAIVDESTPPGDGWSARSCADWEGEARRAAGLGGPGGVLRTAPVLDPEGGLLKQLLLPFKLGLGGPLAGGRQYMPWIHRDDEVGLILWALDDEQVSGALNATAPNPVTNREFSKALGRVLHRPAVMPVPRLALVAMRGEELTEQILGSIRVVPRRALDLGYAFRFPELEPALRDLV